MTLRTVVLLAVAALTACAGDDSVASKSAAAYREAQAKGIPVSDGHDHGGEQADAQTGVSAPHQDHSAHGAMDHSAPAGMDHAAHGTSGTTGHADHRTDTGAPHAQHGMTGGSGQADHTQHAARADADPHAAHRATAAAQSDPHAAHRVPAAAQSDPHAAHRAPAAPQSDPHASHRAPAAPQSDPHASHRATQAPPAAPRGPIELKGDPFDAPAPAAVSEASKAAQSGGGHEGHQSRGITPGEDDENPPTPAPATRTEAGAAADHGQHAAVLYTCPMHPEVTSDKPGTCPKCGMALVEKK